MAYSEPELLSLYREALAEVIPGRSGDWEKVTLDTSFEDLSMDSVTFMELVGSVEERTGKTFPDDQLAQLSTFRDLSALIAR